MNTDNLQYKIVVEGLPAISKTYAYDYEAWMAPYGKVKGMYIFPGRLVIEFYHKLSASTAVRCEAGAVFQGHAVSVSVMQPWHPSILGELIEWIGPENFHVGLVDPEHIPPNACGSFSASKNPAVESDDCQLISSDILLKKVMAESRFLAANQLEAVFEIIQTCRSRFGYCINTSISTAQTEPWLTPNARKLLKKTRALNKRRRSCPSAHLEACFRAKRDRVLEMVEECKAAWLEKIDKEIQECDRVLFEGKLFVIMLLFHTFKASDRACTHKSRQI
uniref:Uncharacterized protein n=1 Tax=Schistocephalus solidus TaxID=70667 RepID=A0A0X3NJQ7_SCHSO